MLKCCIFDLDGTLINSIKDLATAMNYSLNKNGLKEYEIEEYYNFVGNGIKILCKSALNKQNNFNEDTLKSVYIDFKKFYSENCCVYSFVYEGIYELLHILKEKGFILGVFSNKKEEMAKKIINHYFENTFDFVLGETPNYLRKPNPSQLIDCLNKLKIDKSDCIYIGDSEVDARTAKNGYLYSIGITWGFRNKETLNKCPFDVIIDSPNELMNII